MRRVIPSWGSARSEREDSHLEIRALREEGLTARIPARRYCSRAACGVAGDAGHLRRGRTQQTCTLDWPESPRNTPRYVSTHHATSRMR